MWPYTKIRKKRVKHKRLKLIRGKGRERKNFLATFNCVLETTAKQVSPARIFIFPDLIISDCFGRSAQC